MRLIVEFSCSAGTKRPTDLGSSLHLTHVRTHLAALSAFRCCRVCAVAEFPNHTRSVRSLHSFTRGKMAARFTYQREELGTNGTPAAMTPAVVNSLPLRSLPGSGQRVSGCQGPAQALPGTGSGGVLRRWKGIQREEGNKVLTLLLFDYCPNRWRDSVHKYGQNDVVGVTFDFNSQEAEFFGNGVSVFKTKTNLTGPLYFVAGSNNRAKLHIADWPEMSDQPLGGAIAERSFAPSTSQVHLPTMPSVHMRSMHAVL